MLNSYVVTDFLLTERMPILGGFYFVVRVIGALIRIGVRRTYSNYPRRATLTSYSRLHGGRKRTTGTAGEMVG